MSYSAELCQSFFNTAQDAIFVIDAASQTIAEANTPAIHDTGYSLGELKGFCVDSLFRRHDGSSFSFFTNKEREPLDHRSSILRLLKKNGETVAVNASASWFKCNAADYVFLVASKLE